VIEERLVELGIELPPAPQPVASYIPVKVVGDLAWVAGQVPMRDGAISVSGSVGSDVTTEEANAGARRCAIQALSALRAALGSLDRVTGVVKVDVFVASAQGFTDQPSVANGASDLLVEVFGDAGRHARAAVGVPELPLGAAVEVALLVQLG
jgi:enamine deaminase RidA (YjgF/YER057c/UK114 family)